MAKQLLCKWGVTELWFILNTVEQVYCFQNLFTFHENSRNIIIYIVVAILVTRQMVYRT